MTAKGDWLAALVTKYGPDLVDRVKSVLGMDVEPAVFKKAVAREAKAPLAVAVGRKAVAAPETSLAAKTTRATKTTRTVPAAPRSETLPSKYHTPRQVIAKEYNRDIAQRLSGIVPDDAPLSEWRAAADNLAGPEGAAANARFTPELIPPGTEPVVTQLGRQGLPVRGMDSVETQHPSPFSVLAKYKTSKDPLETEVVTTPYANLPVRMFDPTRLEGARVVSLLADKERAGDTILSVDGLPTNVDTQGGPLHAALQEALGGSAVFSNAPGPLTTLRRQIAEGLDAGQPVFGVTTTMSPSAVNQTVDMVELLHQMAANSDVRKPDIAAFNTKMQSILPGYAGLLHPEAVMQLQNMTQGQRKAFVKQLDNADALAMGFPNVGAARFALTDPNLIDVPAGASGYQFVQFGPESLGPANSTIRHRAYPDDIGGTYEGRGPLVPFSTMFSDFTRGRRAEGLPAGSDLRSLEFRKPFQDMTPEAYDLLMRYLSKVEDPY